MGEPIPHRQFLARTRPIKRGPVSCAYPGCGATFKDEWAATQHRIAVHNEGTPHPSQRGLTMNLDYGCWVSPSPEARAREAMKFVRVSLNDGYLTDISISMLLVELKRRGLVIAKGA